MPDAVAETETVVHLGEAVPVEVEEPDDGPDAPSAVSYKFDQLGARRDIMKMTKENRRQLSPHGYGRLMSMLRKYPSTTTEDSETTSDHEYDRRRSAVADFELATRKS